MPKYSPENTKLSQSVSSAVSTEHLANETNDQDPSGTQTRKRTRASTEQLAILEDTFSVNVSPNSKLRKQLAERLQMSERSIQIWFQNRRAKVKHMQKRAHMQMQQASIRAQLYHYHQQQYGAHPPYQGGGSGSGVMHHHQQPHLQHPHYRPYPAVARVPLPRSQSVDQHLGEHHPASSFSSSSVPPAAYHATPTPTPPPSSCYTHWPETPLQPPVSISTSPSSSPNLHYHPYTNTAINTLVSVPDAGPTAILATQDYHYVSPPTTMNVWCSPDILDSTQSILHIDPTQVAVAVGETGADFGTATRALSNPIVTTIDPSSLVLTPPTSMSSGSEEDADAVTITTTTLNTASLNATTLTVGTWHRLKLQSNDLLCAYDGNRHIFSWTIADNGCRFKMEITLDAVASIEYIASDCDVLADVHFDISEPPLFYMKQKDEWVQCSDFTENKQASRFFRHTIKGVAHHMKQELLTLVQKHDETRRLVRFIETPIHPDPLYWSHPFVTEQCAFFG